MYLDMEVDNIVTLSRANQRQDILESRFRILPSSTLHGLARRLGYEPTVHRGSLSEVTYRKVGAKHIRITPC